MSDRALADIDTRASEVPSNLEAEHAVLGAVLLGSRNLMAALIDTGLQPEDFYRQSHGAIWEAMAELHRAGRGIDVLVLAEFLRQTGRLDHIGGRAAVDLLACSVPVLGNAREYGAIVRKLGVWRRRLSAARRMVDACSALHEDAWVAAWREVAP